MDKMRFYIDSFKKKKISVGLDIGSFSIKMVEISQSPEGITLQNYLIKELPLGARGREKRFSPLWEKTIKEVIVHLHETPNYLTLGISGPETAIMRMTLPQIPSPEMEAAIRWEGKKYFTFPLNEASIYYKKMGEKEVDGVKKLDLLVTASLKQAVQKELEALKDYLPKISGITPQPFALKSIFKLSRMREEEGSFALIHLGAEETSINIIKGGELQFSRKIEIAGNDLTQALTEPFSVEGREFNLSIERAEEIKKQYGIPLSDSNQKTEEGIPLSRIMFILRPLLERLLTEIIRSIDFYKTQLKEKGIERVYISGGCAKLKNLREYLTGGLGIETEVLDPFYEISPALPGESLRNLLNAKSELSLALGLAIEKAEEVNLLPPRPHLLESTVFQKFAFYIFPLLFILLLFSFYYRIDRSFKMYQREASMIKNLLNSLHLPPDKIDFLRSKKAELENKLSILNYSPSQIEYPNILMAINRILPSNITLKELSLEEVGENVPTQITISRKEKRFRIKGIVFGRDAERLSTLADLTDSLEQLPYLSSVNLVSTEENRGFNQPATDFTLLCYLRSNSQEKR